MYDIVEGLHKALRIESTWAFVLVVALFFAVVGGLFAWIIDTGYKNSPEYKAEHLPKQQAVAAKQTDQTITAQPNKSGDKEQVDFHMPPGGWMTAWGSKPPDVAYAVADAAQFVPYKDQLRLLLVCRVVDDSIDELQDENIQKSPVFTPTQSAVSMEMHMSQALMLKAGTYSPPQMIHVALVLVKNGVDLGKIKKLADVQPLGGTILVVNGFGMNVKKRRTWMPSKSSDVNKSRTQRDSFEITGGKTVIRSDATPTSASPVTLQNSPGSAVSVNQQGGVTAVVNVDTPRHVSQSEIASIKSSQDMCSALSFINVTASNGNSEAQRYASEVIAALKGAGCKADLLLPIPGLTPDVTGIIIGVRDYNNIDPSARALGAILSNAGLPFSFAPMKPDFFAGERFVLAIGAKN